MHPAKTKVRGPRWLWIPVRILLITFLMMLVSFAVTLLLGILGIMAATYVRGGHSNLTLAYRYIALPTAIVVGAVVLIFISVTEIQHYRRAKTLAAIERSSS